jgi:hypothetical protein
MEDQNAQPGAPARRGQLRHQQTHTRQHFTSLAFARGKL